MHTDTGPELRVLELAMVPAWGRRPPSEAAALARTTDHSLVLLPAGATKLSPSRISLSFLEGYRNTTFLNSIWPLQG